MDKKRFKLSEEFWQKTPEGFSSLYEWNINPVKMACNIFLKQRSKIVLAEALSGNSHETLLDLGCGSGDLGISLSDAFRKLFFLIILKECWILLGKTFPAKLTLK